MSDKASPGLSNPSNPPFDAKALLAPKQNVAKKNIVTAKSLEDRSFSHDSPAASNNDSEGDIAMTDGFGAMLTKFHNVEARSTTGERTLKRRNEDEEDDEQAENKKAQKSDETSAPRGSGGSELGSFFKEKHQKAKAPGDSPNNDIIDLTSREEDDDVLLVHQHENKDREVCLGQIAGAKVNAHAVPAQNRFGFQGTAKAWPATKINLSRRMGTNSLIIAVLDITGKDFGTVDARTAGVLAPLMDLNGAVMGTSKPKSKQSGQIRLQARLDSRKREKYEHPGQQTSASWAITIIIYAPHQKAKGIGKRFKDNQVLLKDPSHVDRGIELCNPHAPKETMRKPQLAPSANRYTSTSSATVRTTEEVRRDVLNIFDSLAPSDGIPEAKIDSVLFTRADKPLLKHQAQALYWMRAREMDRCGDRSAEGEEEQFAEDETSLWIEDRRPNGKPFWYHAITGHELIDRPTAVLGGILADVMGLGKTLSVLALILTSKNQAVAFHDQPPPTAQYDDENDNLEFNTRATLLVCPLSTVSNWESQIKDHIKSPKTSLKYVVYHGPNRPNEPEALRDFDLVITTYSVVAADFEQRSRKRPNNPLRMINWFRIVLDEAHIIREPSTRQSKAVCVLTSQRRWAVTGTPVQNRLEDLGTLIKFLRIRPFDEPRNFAQYIISPFKSADPEILPRLRLLVDSITLRRLKDKINLPKRVELISRLVMTDQECELVDFYARQAQESVNLLLQKGKIGGKGYAHVLKSITRMRLLCAGGADLLSEADWEAAKGASMNLPIDLEDDTNTLPERTPRQAFELYKMMEDSCVNTCGNCERWISPGHTGDRKDAAHDSASSTSDSAADSAPDSESEGQITQNTFGFLSPCNQLICPHCIDTFRAQCVANSGPDHYGHCPLCDTYMRMHFFELKEHEMHADEAAQRELRKNPRLARSAGRYSGPHSKTRALIKHLTEDQQWSEDHADEAPVKSVIFSGWTSHLDLIQLALGDAKISCVRLDGSMTRAQRTAALDAFSSDKSVTCILVSINAGGLGLNLTTASRVYVMEPQFNPAAEQQAIERVHRLGQTRDVLIRKFILEKSFEEKMLVLQQKKKDLATMSLERGMTFDKLESAKEKMEQLRTLFR